MPPFIHKLDKLIDESGIKTIFSEAQLSFIDELTPLNIQARYPACKNSVYKLVSKGKADNILHKTKELWKWLRQNID